MEEKDIERFNILNNQENNFNNISSQQQNMVNGVQQTNTGVNQIWPDAQFYQTPNPADLLKNDIDENNLNDFSNNQSAFSNNTFEQQVMPNVENHDFIEQPTQVTTDSNVQSIQNNSSQVEQTNNENITVQQPIQEQNVKESKKINNGYKEKSNSTFIIIVFILLALVIIFLPQISNLIK